MQAPRKDARRGLSQRRRPSHRHHQGAACQRGLALALVLALALALNLILTLTQAPLANEEEEAASQANGWPPSTTGVAPFRRDYFNCRQTELYADEALATYALLGDRKLKLPWRKALTLA